MRYKMPDDKKRVKTNLTIDTDLIEILESHLSERGIKNLSKYVESLVRKDMEERGEDVKKNF